jgi:hypothetical protein
MEEGVRSCVCKLSIVGHCFLRRVESLLAPVQSGERIGKTHEAGGEVWKDSITGPPSELSPMLDRFS